MDTDDLYSDDYKEYNRRTTDYGNGRIEIAAYHSPRLRYIGSGRTSSGRETETSDKAQEERTRRQVYAIRRRIRGYAFSNNFRWFVTLTFNPEKVDSSDYETAKNTLLKWCRRMRDRHDRQVYNLTEWEYGFSDCEEIESPERAASYITKYVTAALLTDKEMYNKKRYFNSQGLAKPAVSFGMSDNTELDSFTPNFGVIETDRNGKNIIEIGIYNLATVPETGALFQTDNDYLIIAKTERHISPPSTGGKGT